MREGGKRDGMRGEVDEACCLKAVEDGLGGGGSLFWGAVEEEGEVDYLVGLVT